MSVAALDPIVRLHPEEAIGGFTARDHRIVFYNLVGALLTPDSVVLDFGAGRGKWREVDGGWRLKLAELRGRCREVIGADVDPAVLENPMVDRGLVIEAGRIPLPDASVDLIVSWAVFEHIDDPRAVAAELDRVLKPGGWICAWTPNKWGYPGMGARLIPNRLHGRVLRRLGMMGTREAEDVFPVRYRLNTVGAIRRAFPGYENRSFIHNGPPLYFGRSLLLARLFDLYGRLTPRALGQMLHVFVRKPG